MEKVLVARLAAQVAQDNLPGFSFSLEVPCAKSRFGSAVRARAELIATLLCAFRLAVLTPGSTRHHGEQRQLAESSFKPSICRGIRRSRCQSSSCLSRLGRACRFSWSG
jgi:hypothetical protein